MFIVFTFGNGGGSLPSSKDWFTPWPEDDGLCANSKRRRAGHKHPINKSAQKVRIKTFIGEEMRKGMITSAESAKSKARLQVNNMHSRSYRA